MGDRRATGIPCSPNRRNSATKRYAQFATHSYGISIDAAEIDFMGHPSDAIATHAWVALKHEITYRKPTLLDDDVIATAILEKVQGARAFYETVIKRGEEVLAEVHSSWCYLDATTLRPARLAQNVVDHFFAKD